MLGVRTAFDFVHMTPFTDSVVTGRSREPSTIRGLGTNDNCVCYFLWSVFTDEAPAETLQSLLDAT